MLRLCVLAATVLGIAALCAVFKGWIPWRGWIIGPVTRFESRSKGLPLRPVKHGDGWYFDFPHPHRAAGHVHYVQNFSIGNLWGVEAIRLRYRVDGDVTFCPQETPDKQASVSLMIQRPWDTWRKDFHRWFYRIDDLKPGVFDVTIPMENWVSVYGKKSGNNPVEFNDALQDTWNLALVFGGPSGLGHGVYATGPARFTLESLELVKE